MSHRYTFVESSPGLRSNASCLPLPGNALEGYTKGIFSSPAAGTPCNRLSGEVAHCADPPPFSFPFFHHGRSRGRKMPLPKLRARRPDRAPLHCFGTAVAGPGCVADISSIFQSIALVDDCVVTHCACQEYEGDKWARSAEGMPSYCVGCHRLRWPNARASGVVLCCVVGLIYFL